MHHFALTLSDESELHETDLLPDNSRKPKITCYLLKQLVKPWGKST